MNNSKDFVQNQFRKWKNAASQIISPEGEAADYGSSAAVELEPEFYVKCRQMAEAQHTTVSAVVHFMIENYFSVRAHETAFQATVEQKEKNPLLQLDALTRSKERFTEEGNDHEHV